MFLVEDTAVTVCMLRNSENSICTWITLVKRFPGPQCIWDYLLRTALRNSQSDKETNQWTIEVVPQVGTGTTASLVAEGTVGARKGYLTEAVLGLSLEGSADANQAHRAGKASQAERIKCQGHERALRKLQVWLCWQV